jgi:lipopolysaccharide export system permease protein
MRRLNRYIGTTVFVASLGSLMILVGLNVISDMVVSMDDVSDSYPMSSMLLVILLKTPSMITEFLPYGIFVGCIIGLGLHANNNELSVMRAAGVSVHRLLWAVMRPTLLLIVVGMITSEYISPVSNQLARSLQEGGDVNQRALESPFGHWYRDAERNEFLHFNRVETGGRIFGVSRYRFDENGKLLIAGFAEQAIYQRPNWQLENYRQSHFIDDRITLIESQQHTWQTELSPQLLNILVLPPESLSISDVYQYAVYRDQQNLQSHEYWLWFWQRILQPLTVLTLVLVGMSFIFGSLREATMGSRIALAVIVGFFIRVNITMLGKVSTVIGFDPLIAVLAPTLICAALGIFLLARR